MRQKCCDFFVKKATKQPKASGLGIFKLQKICNHRQSRLIVSPFSDFINYFYLVLFFNYFLALVL